MLTPVIQDENAGRSYRFLGGAGVKYSRMAIVLIAAWFYPGRQQDDRAEIIEKLLAGIK
jgi:hypothetical protein